MSGLDEPLRIGPLRKVDWEPEMREFVDGFRSSVASAGPEEGRQAGDNLLGTLARYPDLATSFLTFNRHLLGGSALTVRHRELLVLRVAHVRDADYEWAQHVILAERAGVTPDEIARVREGGGAVGWGDTEAALLASVDQILDVGKIDDATWGVLSKDFDDRGLMDIIFTVGCYAMLAAFLRSLGIQAEPGLAPFLPFRAGEQSA
ncbi:carboxymuconolactone decarboxylase family protein [Gordonia sp. CPCC 206044]|uniref:carboxymuconolactone decarboxylase family protein n=1 Tax=Gordonia sp. CPCC 206044 TaxID=3140793 RepID=UPI003AF36FA6